LHPDLRRGLCVGLFSRNTNENEDEDEDEDDREHNIFVLVLVLVLENSTYQTLDTRYPPNDFS
jgi:hypothetical protein